ncbi:MAG: hypothetical protein RRY35_04090, partial [Clostridiales bacterium]
RAAPAPGARVAALLQPGTAPAAAGAALTASTAVGITTTGCAIPTAAAAAAWFSDGRNADKTPVDYTLAKEVKKPAQARPGMVIYFKQKTFYVKPEEPPIKKNL